LLSSREVAERIGVSQATVLRAVAHGVLKPFHTTAGGHHRFREEDIAAIAGAPPAELRGSGARLLSSGEAARILGVSQPTVLRAVRDGRLRPDETTPGGHYRFSEERLRAVGQPVEGGLVGTGEVARILGISDADVLKQVEEGSLTPAMVTPGGHNRFDASKLGQELPTGAGLRDRWARFVGRLRMGPGMHILPPPPANGNGGNGNGHSNGNGNGHSNGNGNGHSNGNGNGGYAGSGS
jgi:excisionase family DNA binding protein